MKKYFGKGRYFYDFQQLLPKLRSKQEGKCFVCGGTKNLGPHHIKHAGRGSPKYADEFNVVILCKSCHVRYHNRYNKNNLVNAKTFAEFVKDHKDKVIRRYDNDLHVALKRIKKLESELDNMGERSNRRMASKGLVSSDGYSLQRIESYDDFVKFYNDYSVSTDNIMRSCGSRKYRLYRKRALDCGDIVPRPKGLRFY